MHDSLQYAILPAADGQPAIATTHSATYQAAIDGAADVVNTWLEAPAEQSLLDLLHEWLARVPSSAGEPFQDAFILRLQQRLRAGCEGVVESAVMPAEPTQVEGQVDA